MASNPLDKVSLTEAQLATIAGGGSITSGDDTYTADENTQYFTPDTSVSYEAQTLTAEQQAQARQNIGAGTSNFDGAYSSLSGQPTLGTAAALNTGTSQGDIPLLGTNGKLPSSVVPASAITDTFVVSSEAAMLALSSAEVGDVAVRTDLNKSFILKAEPYSTLANWQELLTPTGAVTSVNSQTGAVVLTASDVGAQSTIDSAHKLSADLVEDGTTNKVFTATEQSKLSGIESGAQVNTVTSVNTKTGAVVLNASDVGASNPNLLINGDLSVNQRGEATYTGANKYTADRWQQGSGAFDYSTKTWTPSSQYSGFVQKIEDVDKFKGQTVTISAKINSVSNTSGFDLLINDGSNHRTGTTFTGAGIRSYTYTISASATQVRFGFIYLGTATTDTLSFDWVKVEFGSVATPFSPRPYAEEFALCQRYYQKTRNAITVYAQSTSLAYGWLSLQSSMYTTPTATFPSLSSIYIHGHGDYLASPSSIALNGSIVGNSLEVVVGDTFALNHIYMVHGGEVILEAEL